MCDGCDAAAAVAAAAGGCSGCGRRCGYSQWVWRATEYGSTETVITAAAVPAASVSSPAAPITTMEGGPVSRQAGRPLAVGGWYNRCVPFPLKCWVLVVWPHACRTRMRQVRRIPTPPRSSPLPPLHDIRYMPTNHHHRRITREATAPKPTGEYPLHSSASPPPPFGLVGLIWFELVL